MTYDLLPDVVLIVRDGLASDANVAALVGDRVSTRTPPSFDPALSWLIIQRIGGAPVERHRLDVARIQVSAFGPTEQATSLLARTARVALHLLEGSSSAEGVVTAVEDDLGLTWAPDTSRTPVVPRHIFGVAVYAHAA